jgi:hypothetical protein
MFQSLQQKKIIFLSEFPFSSRDIERFGFEILERNGFFVELWDITDFVLGDHSKHIRRPDIEVWKNLRYFSDEKEILESILQCPQNIIIISLVDFNIATLSIYRVISRKNIDFVVLYLNAFPAPSDSYLPSRKIQTFLRRILQSKLKYLVTTIANIILRKYFWIFGVRPAKAALLGGCKSYEFRNKPIDETTDKVWLHSLDYDVYLQEKLNAVSVDEKQWVFLETYYGADPDQYYCPDEKSYTPDRVYYKKITTLFDEIERIFDIRIVIAEHPKKISDLNIWDYGGRVCYQNRTCELVKTSAVVLSHDSTAVNFAVLFRKPLQFLSSQEIAATENGLKIQALADLLGRTPVFIDEANAEILLRDLNIDDKLYSKYITDFITRNIEETNSWELFSRYLSDRMLTPDYEKNHE